MLDIDEADFIYIYIQFICTYIHNIYTCRYIYVYTFMYMNIYIDKCMLVSSPK
jgi:hypothetical protein